jgi:nucleoside-diphosphate-sugar epimerase
MFELRSRGLPVRGASRSGKSEAPPRVEIVRADARDADAMQKLCVDAEVVYATIGLPYPEWTSEWPKIVAGLVAGAKGKRLVFADNLYAYGPQTRPLTEDMPFTDVGRKPALRARLDRDMLMAHNAGVCNVTLVRASDFYGPRVRQSLLGEQVVAKVVKGKAAQLLPGVDQPHSMTYIDDFARALVDVAVAPDAWGRSWHVPNAPARSVRELVTKLFELSGAPPKMTIMPGFMLSALGWFSPLMREIGEMRQNLERPYLVDSSAFEARFGWKGTPLDKGLEKTLEWYRRADAPGFGELATPRG